MLLDYVRALQREQNNIWPSQRVQCQSDKRNRDQQTLTDRSTAVDYTLWSAKNNTVIIYCSKKTI